MILGKHAGALLLLLPWLIFIVLLPLFPHEAMAAALRGVSIWWEVLFPALLPFFIIAELLLGIGLVHLIGSLFDPMMKPVFRVPGYGGFIMAMGFASGYPIGARLTAQLWEERLITREEGERLVAFTTSSDPIFLIGAVCVGFFHDPSLAVILAAAHYGGGLLVGFGMRFHGGRTDAEQFVHRERVPPLHPLTYVKRAINDMHRARIADGRSLIRMLQDAIQTSLKLVFIIGGLVVFISVLLELLTAIGGMRILYLAVQHTLGVLGLPAGLAEALVNGMFEVTLGAQAAGVALADSSLIHQVAVAAFVLSWAGLSVHAQIISLLTSTNLRYLPFVIARLGHGLISMLLVYLLWKPLSSLREAAAATTAGFGESLTPLKLGVASVPILFLGVLMLIPILYLLYLVMMRVIRLIRPQPSRSTHD